MPKSITRYTDDEIVAAMTEQLEVSGERGLTLATAQRLGLNHRSLSSRISRMRKEGRTDVPLTLPGRPSGRPAGPRCQHCGAAAWAQRPQYILRSAIVPLDGMPAEST